MAGEGRGMPAGHQGREETKSVYTEYGEREPGGHGRAGEEEERRHKLSGGKSYPREAYRIFFPDI